MRKVDVKFMENVLRVNPDDEELDFENNEDIIEAFIVNVNLLEEKGVDRWLIIQEFQNKFDRFVDVIRGIDRGENPTCWIMANALAIRQETAELIDGLDWKHWKNSSEKVKREYMLEELVDILHFYVSMLISMGVDIMEVVPIGGLVDVIVSSKVGEGSGCKVGDREVMKFVLLSDELSRHAMGIYNMVSQKSGSCDCFNDIIKGVLVEMMALILTINRELGYSFDDLYSAYLRKNLKNFIRQVSPKFRGGSYYVGDKRDIAVKIINEVWFKVKP